MTYGYSISWTKFNGEKTKVTITQCDNPTYAVLECIESAMKFGWTYPKWWEWWRWNDTRPSIFED